MSTYGCHHKISEVASLGLGLNAKHHPMPSLQTYPMPSFQT